MVRTKAEQSPAASLQARGRIFLILRFERFTKVNMQVAII
jgi:hypothetical protein